MRETFLGLYRQLGRVTVAALWILFGLFVLTLGCALLGFQRAAISLGQASLAMAYFAGTIFAVLAIAYLVQAVCMRLSRTI